MVQPAVRPLAVDEAEAYARLRSVMLVDTPHAFASSPGEAKGEKAEGIIEYLADPHQAIAVVDHPDTPGELSASAGIMRRKHQKLRHRADIWGVYCVPELRGRGFGRAVMIHAIELARAWEGIEVIGLSVSARSPSAIALYESLGFQHWGIEPDALRIDGESFDEIHLTLRLSSHMDTPAGS